MQSGRQETLEERYEIKFCFKHGKMPQKRIECFRLLFDHFAWIEHQFFSGLRDSRKAGSLWAMTRGVGGVWKSIDQSWLAKGLGLLCWGCKGVQEEIPSEEARTLRVSGIFTRTMHQPTTLSLSQTIWPRWASTQFLTLPIVQTLLPVTFGYSLSSAAVVMYETIEKMKETVTTVIDTPTQEYFHGASQKLLERYNKCITARGDYSEGE